MSLFERFYERDPRGGRRFARAHSRHDHAEGHSGRGHRGPGGRLARLLEHGDLRLLILHLISEKPRHGYEIIKAIEELAGGEYAPSPGVVYPTLTLLEELGQVVSTAEASRKSYEITPAGTEALATGQESLNAILARIAEAQPREHAQPVLRALENLTSVLRTKIRTKATSPEVVGTIVDTLDAIARKIEAM
jgi:DNA-binding PadR family transcriptional regulator